MGTAWLASQGDPPTSRSIRRLVVEDIEIWRLRCRRSVLWALHTRVGSQFIRHTLCAGIVPVRLRQWGMEGRIRRRNKLVQPGGVLRQKHRTAHE